MGRDKLVDQVAAALRDQAVDRGDAIVVAYSGGVDSGVLLHVLATLRLPRLHAVYVNHRLRPAVELAEEEQFVFATAFSLGVGLRIHRVSPTAVSAAVAHSGVESAARAVRYGVLHDHRRRLTARWIMTAHHLDDAIETHLMAMFRGTPGSVAGLPARNGRIVRPLVGCSAATVRAYARSHAVPFVQDSTNGDRRYLRNALRAAAMPQLNAVFGSSRTAAGRYLARQLAVWDCVRRTARRSYRRHAAADGSFPRPAFIALHPTLRTEILLMMFRRFRRRRPVATIAAGEAPLRLRFSAVARFAALVSARSCCTIPVNHGYRLVCAADRLFWTTAVVHNGRLRYLSTGWFGETFSGGSWFLGVLRRSSVESCCSAGSSEFLIRTPTIADRLVHNGGNRSVGELLKLQGFATAAVSRVLFVETRDGPVAVLLGHLGGCDVVADSQVLAIEYVVSSRVSVPDTDAGRNS